MRPTCIKCEVDYRPKRNGIYVVQMNATTTDSLWSADLWVCPVCKAEIVQGFGDNPIARGEDVGPVLVKAAIEGLARDIYPNWIDHRDRVRYYTARQWADLACFDAHPFDGPERTDYDSKTEAVRVFYEIVPEEKPSTDCPGHAAYLTALRVMLRGIDISHALADPEFADIALEIDAEANYNAEQNAQKNM